MGDDARVGGALDEGLPLVGPGRDVHGYAHEQDAVSRPLPHTVDQEARAVAYLHRPRPQACLSSSSSASCSRLRPGPRKNVRMGKRREERCVAKPGADLLVGY
jgi:hypothetical protein